LDRVGKQGELIEEARVLATSTRSVGVSQCKAFVQRSCIHQLSAPAVKDMRVRLAARMRRRQIAVDVAQAVPRDAGPGSAIRHRAIPRRCAPKSSRRATNAGVSTSSGVRSSPKRDKNLPKASLPLSRDKGTGEKTGRGVRAIPKPATAAR